MNKDDGKKGFVSRPFPFHSFMELLRERGRERERVSDKERESE